MVLKACQNVPVENGENGQEEPTVVPVVSQPVDEVMNRKVSKYLQME